MKTPFVRELNYWGQYIFFHFPDNIHVSKKKSIHFPIESLAYGDSLDWKNLSATEISKRVTSRVQPGSIILFHNAAKNTPEALPSIIETLLKEGYSFEPISELILSGSYVMDHSGKQCPVTTP